MSVYVAFLFPVVLVSCFFFLFFFFLIARSEVHKGLDPSSYIVQIAPKKNEPLYQKDYISEASLPSVKVKSCCIL